MAHLTFPPSANWYCAKVSDISVGSPRLLAFGAKESICIFHMGGKQDSRSVVPSDLIMVSRYYGHAADARVSALSFSRHKALQHMLVSGCSRGHVHIWDTKKQGHTIFESEKSFSVHKDAITALSLPELAPEVVITGDTKGQIAVLKLGSDTGNHVTAIFEPLKGCGAITSLECSPYTREEVVIGFRNGGLAVFNWESFCLLRRLDGHTQEVHGLAFFPVSNRKWYNGRRAAVLDNMMKEMNLLDHATIDVENTDESMSATVLSPVEMTVTRRVYSPISLRRLRRSRQSRIKSGGLDVLPESLRRFHLKHVVGAKQKLHDLFQPLPPLLASTSRDRTIRIWNTTNWTEVDCLHLPLPGGGADGWKSKGKGKNDFRGYKGGRATTSSQTDRLWLTAAWSPCPRLLPRSRKIKYDAVDEIGILTSSYMGELLYWPWNCTGLNKKETNSGSRPVSIISPSIVDKSGHSRPVYNILTVPMLDEACDINQTNANVDDTIVTISMDRSILIRSLMFPNTHVELPGLGGHIYAIDSSLLTPNFIFMAIGDKSIRTWDTSSLQDPRRSKLHWKGLQNEVTSLTCHPHREGMVIYGTSVGRVGLYDTIHEVNTPFKCMTVSPACCIDWRSLRVLPASSIGDERQSKTKCKSTDLLVYSCSGNGNLFEYNPNQPNSHGFNVVEVLRLGGQSGASVITTFSWNHAQERSTDDDRGLIALGYKDGSLRIFEVPNIPFSTMTIAQQEEITLRSYHCHIQTITSIKWCPHKTNGILLATGSEDRTCRVIDVSMGAEQPEQHIFRGHLKPVACVAWHPSKMLLASASHDGTANVWDIGANAPLANCRGHGDRIKCICWSLTNDAYLYTGSEDQSIMVWDIYKQEKQVPPTKTDQSALDFLVRMRKARAAAMGTHGAKNSAVVFKEGKKKLKSLVARLSANKFELSHLISLVSESKLSRATEDDSDVNDWRLLSCSDLLVSKQISSHKEHGDFEAARHLAIWSGDVAATAKEMAREKRLTADLVALSASAGLSTWKLVSKAYAEQLESSGKIHMAVSYYLAVSELHKALKAYLNHNMVYDALLLATSRLSTRDPIITPILMELGKRLERQGDFLMAHDAFLAAGDGERAKVSQRRHKSIQDGKHNHSADTVVVEKEAPSIELGGASVVENDATNIDAVSCNLSSS